MNRSRVTGAIVVLVALTAVVWWWRGRGVAPPVPIGSEPTPAVSATEPKPADAPSELPLADLAAFAGLNASSGDARADLMIVSSLIANYRESVKSATAPPMGTNEEIARALTGANPLGIAFLPARHPSIDAAGRWCDRWGTPYLFHPLSSAAMEVRSAGPDRKLFSADDVVLRPPVEGLLPES